MKESKRLSIKEWAESNGLSVNDYDEAKSLKNDFNAYKAGYWIFLVMLVVAMAFSIYRDETVMTRCIENVLSLKDAFDYDAASRACHELIGVR